MSKNQKLDPGIMLLALIFTGIGIASLGIGPPMGWIFGLPALVFGIMLLNLGLGGKEDNFVGKITDICMTLMRWFLGFVIIYGILKLLTSPL
jgi:hypothetical protein